MSQTAMVRKAILAILRSLPRSPIVSVVYSDLLRHRDAAVTEHVVDPREYRAASDFGPDYLAANIARKWSGLNTGIDTEMVARLGFLEQEARNAAFNTKGVSLPPDCARAHRISGIILMAQRKISEVLGSFDPVEFSRSCSFSSGASYSLTRRFGDQAYKYVHGELEVTSEAYPLARLIVESSPRWEAEGMSFRKVAGSRFATVPKDSTKDRCIVIDPRMNIYLQKGIGEMIRRRLLKKARIDLNDQRVNRHLAHVGSFRNEFNLATIDLSAASDSITSRLVMDLLPVPWFRVLSSLRSHRVVMPDGSLHELEMFSGMGNGFTFELETLIFWALASAAIEENEPTTPQDRTCKVYGDDIVVPSRHYENVTDVLVSCGFTVNTRKSFYFGGFRESCGGHYFLGRDVTPFYIEGATDTAMDLIHIANAYHYWCKRLPEMANQGVFDYICSLAQKCAKGKMSMVPAREGLKAGLIWSAVRLTLDKEHAAMRKHCRRLPKYSTILVDRLGAALVRDDDWNNIGSCYQYNRFSYNVDSGEVLPSNGSYLAALQKMERGPAPELPYDTSLKGKVKCRRIKTTSWCDFTPLFEVPRVFV